MKLLRLQSGCLIFLILAGTCMLEARTVGAYYISYLLLNHRLYEDGQSFNRLNFDLREDDGQYVTDGRVVTGAVLYDPTTQPINLTSTEFYSEDIGEGSYNGNTGIWTFDPWESLTGFYSTFSGDLQVGMYRLVLTTDRGNVEKTVWFDGLVDLAPVSSKTFTIYPDAGGNLYWTWELPKALGPLGAGTDATSVRALIESYTNGKHVSFSVKLPTHMGYLFLPSSVVQDLAARGDHFDFRVQVRTNNNNNRSYSNVLTVNNLQTPVNPRKKAVVIPLN